MLETSNLSLETMCLQVNTHSNLRAWCEQLNLYFQEKYVSNGMETPLGAPFMKALFRRVTINGTPIVRNACGKAFGPGLELLSEETAGSTLYNMFVRVASEPDHAQAEYVKNELSGLTISYKSSEFGQQYSRFKELLGEYAIVAGKPLDEETTKAILRKTLGHSGWHDILNGIATQLEPVSCSQIMDRLDFHWRNASMPLHPIMPRAVREVAVSQHVGMPNYGVPTPPAPSVHHGPLHCSRCNKNGHDGKSCPHRSTTCGTCGRVGHPQFNCRVRKSAEAENRARAQSLLPISGFRGPNHSQVLQVVRPPTLRESYFTGREVSEQLGNKSFKSAPVPSFMSILPPTTTVIAAPVVAPAIDEEELKITSIIPPLKKRVPMVRKAKAPTEAVNKPVVPAPAKMPEPEPIVQIAKEPAIEPAVVEEGEVTENTKSN